MISFGGRKSTVGIATRHGQDGSGFVTRWVRNYPHSLKKPSPNQPSLLYTGYQDPFAGVKRQGCGVDHPLPPSA